MTHPPFLGLNVPFFVIEDTCQEKFTNNPIFFFKDASTYHDDHDDKQTATMAMNVATAAPSGRENEAKKGMKAAGFGIPGIPEEIK